MSPETIVGQFNVIILICILTKKYDEGKTFAEAWEGVFASVEYDLLPTRIKTKNLHLYMKMVQ